MSNRSSASSALIILTLIIGMGGLGLGAYSVFLQPPIPGAPGVPGEDGEDGAPGGGGIVVGILDPDQGDIISGTVEIRALVAGSDQYTISVKINGTEEGTSLPVQWDTTGASGDGWYNITVIATDVASGNTTQDEVIVYVLNNPEENHVYYCSSQSEINSALTDIGTGDGTIIITEDITLTSTITINGGGSYIIQGVSPSITVDCGGNRNAFYISSVDSCILRDLTIDARDLLTTTYVIRLTDRLIHIDNVRIFGDGDRTGYGIYMTQPEVWVSNCHISQMWIGIYVYQNLHSIHITDNTIIDCNRGNAGTGIHIHTSSRVICEGNYIATCFTAIMNSMGENCIIANNMLYQNTNYGINCYGVNSSIIGNSIIGDTSSSGFVYGIILQSGADYNVLTGNVITFHHSSSDTGYGLRIASGADGNVIDGNTMLSNEDDYSNSSMTTVEGENNYVT